MSWSVSLIGRAPAVVVAAAKAFSECKPDGECEKVALDAATRTVDCLLNYYPDSAAVRVEASCTQDKPLKVGSISQCCIAVTPVYGFVV